MGFITARTNSSSMPPWNSTSPFTSSRIHALPQLDACYRRRPGRRGAKLVHVDAGIDWRGADISKSHMDLIAPGLFGSIEGRVGTRQNFIRGIAMLK